MLKESFATERGTYVMLTLTALFWGGNYVASKVFVSEAPPITAAFVRFVFATLLILAIYSREPGARLPRRDEVGPLAAVGLIFFLYNVFFYSGLKLTTSSNASLLAAASPALTALLTARETGERVKTRQIGGIALSFAGVALVVTMDLTRLAEFRFNWGDLWILTASLSWSFYTLWGKQAMATLSPLAVTSYAWVIGTLLLFPAALLEPHSHGWFAFSVRAWWNLFYVVVFSSVAAFTWWYKGVQVIGANRSAIFVNLIPVTGLALAVLFLGEKVSPQQIAGALLILGGVYLVALSGKSRNHGRIARLPGGKCVGIS